MPLILLLKITNRLNKQGYSKYGPVALTRLINEFKTHRCAFDFDYKFVRSVMIDGLECPVASILLPTTGYIAVYHNIEIFSVSILDLWWLPDRVQGHKRAPSHIPATLRRGHYLLQWPKRCHEILCERMHKAAICKMQTVKACINRNYQINRATAIHARTTTSMGMTNIGKSYEKNSAMKIFRTAASINLGIEKEKVINVKAFLDDKIKADIAREN